ncbi:hypothetical protein [Georgenia muralis]
MGAFALDVGAGGVAFGGGGGGQGAAQVAGRLSVVELGADGVELLTQSSCSRTWAFSASDRSARSVTAKRRSGPSAARVREALIDNGRY